MADNKCPSPTVALSIIKRRCFATSPTAAVFLVGHNFKVCGINAGTVAAQMVKRLMGGDSTMVRFLKSEAVGKKLLAMPPKNTIAPLIATASPLPAVRRLFYLLPEVFLCSQPQRINSMATSFSTPIAPQAFVMPFAKRASIRADRLVATGERTNHKGASFVVSMAPLYSILKGGVK